MKPGSSFAKERYSDELQLLRSNMEILPFPNPNETNNLSTPKIEHVQRSKSRIPQQLNYQNLLTFSFQKENSKKLSFSNLKKSLKSQSSNNCCGVHPSKMAKYKQADSNRFYCKQCAIQVASKGIKVQEIMLDSSGVDLSKVIDTCSLKITETNQILGREFNKVKAAIGHQIQSINQYYTALIQRISQMQIRDIMLYQTCLQSAERQYNLALGEIDMSNRQLISIPKSLSQEDISMICQVITNNMQKIGNTKFQVIKQDAQLKYKMDNINNNIEMLHLNIGNRKSRITAISQILKSNSTFESEKYKKEAKITESVQDTPQSLKKKLSVSGKSIVEFQQLKTIEFCQSITDLPEMLQEERRMQQTPKMSDGPKHRYGDDLDYDE